MNRLLLEIALLWELAFGTFLNVVTSEQAIPVDFYVFLGKDGEQEGVAPRTSMNIEPPNDVIGFPALCKDRCPMFNVGCGAGCTAPQMRWCRCVAELLVKDLIADFSTLHTESSPIFTLGEYKELSNGQDHFMVANGHETLYSLMEADASKPYARRSGRIAVWVAQHVGSPSGADSYLAGTTLLDQPLWQGAEGAGVLLHAPNDRSGKILSHEVGHVVGFHHTAGPSMLYTYDHPQCPKETRKVESHPLVYPSCEVNIMGYWYDGPYCCPGEYPSFLLQLRGGRSQRKKCLEHDLSNYQEAHCCGSECFHSCPKEMPEAKFDTKEHKEPLAKMLSCWLHLRTVTKPKAEPKDDRYNPFGPNLINTTHAGKQKRSVVECFDYGRRPELALGDGRKLGACTVQLVDF